MCVPLVDLVLLLPRQGALVGLYADQRYKSGDDDKKPLPLKSIEIIGGEVWYTGTCTRMFAPRIVHYAAVLAVCPEGGNIAAWVRSYPKNQLTVFTSWA